jgi:PAS domain S-box-containing protein
MGANGDVTAADRGDAATGLRATPLAMAIVNMDGVIEFINPQASRMSGYLPEDIPNMHSWWLRAYPDEDYRREVVFTWTGLFQQALADDSEIAGREYRVTCKDGTIKTVFISGVPVADKVLVLFDEVADRKRGEPMLGDDAEKLRRAFENAPVAVNILGADGQFLSVNPAFCQMVGYASHELLGGTFNDITHPADIEPGNRWIRALLSGDQGHPEIDRRFIHKDGSVVCGVVWARWLRKADGSPRLMVAHVKDVTEKRWAGGEPEGGRPGVGRR